MFVLFMGMLCSGDGLFLILFDLVKFNVKVGGGGELVLICDVWDLERNLVWNWFVEGLLI